MTKTVSQFQAAIEALDPDKITGKVEDLIMWFRDNDLSPLEALVLIRCTMTLIIEWQKEDANADNAAKLH